MKKIYCYLIFCFVLVILGACQNEELKPDAVGYLKLEVGTDKSTLTKAGGVYNPKQIAVKILNSAGEIIEETDDWTKWTEAIELPVGKYTIEASSAGFDGKTAGWDKPYYAAKETVDIKMNTNTSKEIVCKLANVLVTVEFSDDFKAAFRSAVVGVSDKNNSNNKVTFEMRQASETGKAYFPVTNLIANLTVSNYDSDIHSKKDTITGIKAQENVILRYRIASSGSSNINVSIDDETKTYTYTIGVPVTSTSTLIASANAWSTFAYLTAEIPSFADVFDQSKLEFQYKTDGAEEWTKVTNNITVEEKDKKFSTKLTGLIPTEAYQYRLYYNDGSEEGITSNIVDFRTENALQLQNCGFEDWCQSGDVLYAATQEDITNRTYCWDTSNPGSGEYGYNPTSQSTEIKHGGNSSAKLTTEYAVIKLAAASLYYGRFNSLTGGLIPKGAKIDFGQPFTSRPIVFKGYFQYAPVAIDNYNNPPAGTVQKGDMDICSIYIALSKKAYTVDNTDVSTFIDFAGDRNIIAYGELPASECISTNGQWKEFNIPLKYKNLTEKPSYIIIVCSSSKYGDYFTGGKGSTMYLDDFELIYDGEPTIWDLN